MLETHNFILAFFLPHRDYDSSNIILSLNFPFSSAFFSLIFTNSFRSNSSALSSFLNSSISSNNFSFNFCQYSASSAMWIIGAPPFLRIYAGILSLTNLLYFRVLIFRGAYVFRHATQSQLSNIVLLRAYALRPPRD